MPTDVAAPQAAAHVPHGQWLVVRGLVRARRRPAGTRRRLTGARRRPAPTPAAQGTSRRSLTLSLSRIVWTSCYSDGSDKRHRRRRTNSSTIFARWRRCAPNLIHSSLGPHESLSQSLRYSISIGLVIFAGLTVVNPQTDSHTDRPCHSICSNRAACDAA